MGMIEKLFNVSKDYATKVHKVPNEYKEEDLPVLEDIIDDIPTGSILLCSGVAPESRLIQEVSRTDFSHSAMIVRLKDKDDVYLWSADVITRLQCNIAKKRCPGTHLLTLKEYLKTVNKIYLSPDGSRYRFAISKLRTNKLDENHMLEIFQKLSCHPFPETKEEFLNWLKGQARISSNNDRFFCSHLLAFTYQELGLMKKKYPPNHYSPGQFSRRSINNHLEKGVYLEEYIYFKTKEH